MTSPSATAFDPVAAAGHAFLHALMSRQEVEAAVPTATYHRLEHVLDSAVDSARDGVVAAIAADDRSSLAPAREVLGEQGVFVDVHRSLAAAVAYTVADDNALVQRMPLPDRRNLKLVLQGESLADLGEVIPVDPADLQLAAALRRVVTGIMRNGIDLTDPGRGAEL